MALDSCGVAGGGRAAGEESGEHNKTAYAKQGDLGSKLPAVPSTMWKAGGLGLAGWFIRANHGVPMLLSAFPEHVLVGGGYAFRLCLAGEKLDEKCFNKIHLDFEGPQVLRWNDGSTEEIDGTCVTEGTCPKGSVWVRRELLPEMFALETFTLHFSSASCDAGYQYIFEIMN